MHFLINKNKSLYNEQIKIKKIQDEKKTTYTHTNTITTTVYHGVFSS